MCRTLFACLGFLSFVPSMTPRGPSNRTQLKNPVEIRVTSANGESVPFHVEVLGGSLVRVGADGRWYAASGGANRTPAQFRAFPQGPGLLFTSDQGQSLHVEAWRMLGNTLHSSLDGSALILAQPARPIHPRSLRRLRSQLVKPRCLTSA